MKTYFLIVVFIFTPFLYSNKSNQIDIERVYLRVFKFEKILEIWIKENNQDTFRLYKKYDICKLSGTLGPKRKYGDLQVPEGFYEIIDYNKHSSYYLSLGINYPNKSDSILGNIKNLGGSIYIHGNCVSTGCVAMGNQNIKDIFLLCEKAKNNGQKKIPVHIFPVNFNDSLSESQLLYFAKDKENMLKFILNIKQGFTYFENNKIVPKISVDSLGTYVFVSL